MPRCFKCGKAYQAKYISGFCNDCLQADKPETESASLPSSSQISFESYEKEVERVKAAQSASSLRKKGSRYSSTVMLVAFGFLALLILASLAITFLAFGLTRHGVLWSLSIIFFFVGASAIVTKRLLGKRAAKPEVAAQIEPAVAGVVGGLCLLPLALCAFYYSTHTDMPPNHSLWIVGIMLVLALVAVVAGSVALSKAS